MLGDRVTLDTRTTTHLVLQGPRGALPCRCGAVSVSWDRGRARPAFTCCTPRVPEGQACPPNRELSATSCVSKPQGPQEHRPMLAWSYTPADAIVPSQKPLGVASAWGQRLVSSPEMPWAGISGTGSSVANLGAGWQPLTRCPGRWGLTQLVHLVSECCVSPGRQLQGPLYPLDKVAFRPEASVSHIFPFSALPSPPQSLHPPDATPCFPHWPLTLHTGCHCLAP